MKLNTDIKISTWINNNLITNENWMIYSEEENDNTLIILLKDPNEKTEIKLRVERKNL